jgi:hypothetical protein
MDSLQGIKFTGTITGPPSTGETTEGWYIEKSGIRAWVDKIIIDQPVSGGGTEQVLYFHQNSASRQINAYNGGSTTNYAGSTLDEWTDASATFNLYDVNNTLKGTLTQDGAVRNAEHNEKTGTVLFLENRSGIKRTTAQTEKVRIILQF